MKKTILTIAIAIMSVIGIDAFAQQPEQAKVQLCEQENSKKCPKKEWKDKQNRKVRTNHKRQHANYELFNGIELSETQKEEIFKIDNERHEKNQKIDQKNRDNRQKVQNEYDKKMKKILTPEQYNKYLSNKDKSKANRDKVKRNFKKHNVKMEKKQHMHKKDSMLQQKRHQKQPLN